MKEDIIADKYIRMPSTSTYALGVEALRKLGHKPFTFKENILARVEAFESGDYRLFNRWLDSCTGIVYKADTEKFKIVPNCAELCRIPAGFLEKFMPVEYAKIEGIELDSSTNARYNTSLRKKEIVEHPAWLAAVEEDKYLLKKYRDIVLKVYAVKRGETNHLMSFSLGGHPPTDELRSLFVNYIAHKSDAGCKYSMGRNDYLDVNGSFIRRW